MKSIHWFGALVLCCSLSPAVRAEESTITVIRVTPVLDTELLEYILSHERAEVFERAMTLDSKQGDAFWNVYDQYEQEKEELDGKRLRLLGTYIGKHHTPVRRGGQHVDGTGGGQSTGRSGPSPEILQAHE